ncbi:MAG: succinate dehydrogenase/fumarate reductase iron-sulfur subunit [Gemmataceae bacterium]
MKLNLKVWRQDGPNAPGQMKDYVANNVDPEMSFLEMLDVVNEGLIARGEEPIAFEYDCREGICGTCSLMINGSAHGPNRGVTTCQIYLRDFNDGDTIWIEPWRAEGFPLLKDLVVDRSAFDRIVQAGGFISINTGNAPDANALPVGKEDAEQAMDAAACIGCGACVAACPNASAMLFVSAKVGHLSKVPQGQPERRKRVHAMVTQMDLEGFGSCTNHYECEAACPKNISANWISQMNRDYLRATWAGV